jgi:ABC-2 type transport system ATP-binding protein
MNILEVNHVSKQYTNHLALDDVSIHVPEGSIVGLLGPNGAGKTSLIRIITQITAADVGDIFFKGKKLSPEHTYQIGYLPEERGLYKKMTVGEQLMYFAQLKGLNQSTASKRLEEWAVRFDIKHWWNKKVEELSKGMQQKVQFIATVIHQPSLIILDEPFTGFDPINASLIKDEILRLKQEGSAIIFSTHRMESVEELCDHIVLINKSKKILEGSIDQIRKQFGKNEFEVDYSNGVLLPNGKFDIISQFQIKDMQHALLKASANTSPNELLRSLIEMVEVHRFAECIPSMQEVFIESVNGNQQINSTT